MLKELKSQHRNIIQMAFNGYKNQEIAERLGMAQSSVSTILRSPLGQAYLNGLQDRAHEATLDVRKKLVSLNKAALDTFSRILDPKEKAPHSVQFNTAKDVLDRNGYKAPDRLNIDMTLQTKSDEELNAEIAALEAIINKDSNVRSLPGNKSSSVQTVLPETPSPRYESVSSSLCSPDPEPAPIEEQFSLEDFELPDLAYPDLTYPDLDLPNIDEPALIEDLEILNGLPADIFRSNKDR